MPVDQGTVLTFARGYRLQHDRVRDVWIIQAPEKAFIVEGAAPHILQSLDGMRTISDIIDMLASQFSAPRDLIATDVVVLLSDLLEKRVLQR